MLLLDGTWSQAKALWWRNPWMLKCQRVILNPAHPSRYGRLRREPRKDGLSTIEAAATLLSGLERRPDIAETLNASFERLLTRYREVQAEMPELAPKPTPKAGAAISAAAKSPDCLVPGFDGAFCRVRPICSRVKHLEIDDVSCLCYRNRFHARLIRYVRRKHDAWKLHDRRVNFEKYCVPDTAFLTRKKLHWMDVVAHPLERVGVSAPLVATGRRNSDASFG
ncbi:hypothetical protein ABH991_008254 [Bradyrhizobium ottawaense]|uniref:tRNA-uridine aminocarboxypropyltransferase n=1 Tax=Bradyrhizobium ottawaense TaxID=931866 RepID=A0ABV4FJ56_9BRAD